MLDNKPLFVSSRRGFLAGAAGLGFGLAGSTAFGQAMSPQPAKWRDHIGLQMSTVLDKFEADYPGTLKSAAAAGYKEVQPTKDYAGYTPEQIKGFLDQYGLTAPATHVSPLAGPTFERTLEGYAKMGHRYTTIETANGPNGTMPPKGAPPRKVVDQYTVDEVKRMAAELNAAGEITMRHGLKVIVHNHHIEFSTLR